MLYQALNISPKDSDRTVLREVWRRLDPAVRRSRRFRLLRKIAYSEALYYHHNMQDLFYWPGVEVRQ